MCKERASAFDPYPLAFLLLFVCFGEIAPLIWRNAATFSISLSFSLSKIKYQERLTFVGKFRCFPTNGTDNCFRIKNGNEIDSKPICKTTVNLSLSVSRRGLELVINANSKEHFGRFDQNGKKAILRKL